VVDRDAAYRLGPHFNAATPSTFIALPRTSGAPFLGTSLATPLLQETGVALVSELCTGPPIG
jgi:hypothetical protein